MNPALWWNGPGAAAQLGLYPRSSVPFLSWLGNMCHGKEYVNRFQLTDLFLCPWWKMWQGGMGLRATVNREVLGFFPPCTIMRTVNFWVTGWHPSRSNHLPSTGISQCTSLKWWAGSVCSADRSVAVANSIASPQSKKGENITTSEREHRETLYCSFH